MAVDADKLIAAVSPEGDASKFTWEGFSLADTKREIERVFIERALTDSKNVTRAALLLGYSHQRFTKLLKSHHSEVRQQRNLKPRRRRKSLMRKDSRRRSVKRSEEATL